MKMRYALRLLLFSAPMGEEIRVKMGVVSVDFFSLKDAFIENVFRRVIESKPLYHGQFFLLD